MQGGEKRATSWIPIADSGAEGTAHTCPFIQHALRTVPTASRPLRRESARYARPMRRATLAGLIVAVALAGCGTATTAAVTSGHGEHKPACYPAIITENSGNGPTYKVRICDALPKPRPGHEWELIVDGGPLGNRAVIFGQQLPR